MAKKMIIRAKCKETVEEFLAKQKVIRVSTDDMPGFGNQAASASLIIHLRQLGFNGKVEFIYANLTTAKIATLFDLPPNIPNVYYKKDANIVFIKLQEFISRKKNKTNDHLALGITGASDRFGCILARDDGVNVFHQMDELGCYNPAEFLDVEVHTKLTPFYDQSNYIQREKTSFLKGVPPQENSVNKFLIASVSTISQAKKYLIDTSMGNKILKQKPALKTFINGMEQQKFNSFPLYGYSIQKDICEKMTFEGCFPGNILQIIAGARYAQLNGLSHFQKPLVIPVFYPYEKESAVLQHLIQSKHWGEYEQPGAVEARKVIKQLELAEFFSIATISDWNAVKQIQQLKEGQILLLSLGSLPQVLFQGLYNYVGPNIWPQIREGANSFNSLILSGKPHIRCPAWEYHFDIEMDHDLQKRLTTFYGGYPDGFCYGMPTWLTNSEIYQLLGNLIIEANNESSLYSDYFQQLKTTALKPQNDRIRLGIEGALNLLPTSYREVDCKNQISSASHSVTPFSILFSTGERIFSSLFAKPIEDLGSFVSNYFNHLVEVIQHSETYFPAANRNLWCSGNPHTLFNVSNKNNISHSTSHMLSATSHYPHRIN